MAQDHQLAPVQLSHENAEVERLRIRSERIDLIARALETLARSRELLVKADDDHRAVRCGRFEVNIASYRRSRTV